ncbi:MAG TPA: His/Gly/Thr/Pro-type tRNA ligase C-terminal domain-containing protein, partial [Deltaproteobacteria bacterium]|nr:His/Gly/Thr/Pro-type tRNA ligase C-terminal domain-containing protein [Deltaproteobacteria bacterium]
GDPCPRCREGSLQAIRGIEVGHIFKLGTKYSKTMNANFLDVNGNLKPIVMGCYGIGVSRVLAAAIEQYADENGIVFPVPIAPFKVLVLPVSTSEEKVMDAALALYDELGSQGVETLIDDRDMRPGVKFMDADLIGVPFRITVGMRGLNEGIVEVKERSTGTVEKVPVQEVVGYCLAKLDL